MSTQRVPTFEGRNQRKRKHDQEAWRLTQPAQFHRDQWGGQKPGVRWQQAGKERSSRRLQAFP